MSKIKAGNYGFAKIELPRKMTISLGLSVDEYFCR
jgi:hypothetical protein